MKRARVENHAAENLRFLLWRHGVPRNRWVEQTRSWAGCDLRRAATLLGKGDLHEAEAKAIADATHVSAEEIRFARLVADGGTDILRENLRYLVRNLERGRKKALASELGVHATTISRWCSGKQHPEKATLLALSRHFGLRSDLETDPVFLSLSPVSIAARKTWLHDRIDGLDAETLAALFPALERLLGDR